MFLLLFTLRDSPSGDSASGWSLFSHPEALGWFWIFRHGLYHQSTTGVALRNEKKPFTHLFIPAGTAFLGNHTTGRGDGHQQTSHHYHHGNQSFLPYFDNSSLRLLNVSGLTSAFKCGSESHMIVLFVQGTRLTPENDTVVTVTIATFWHLECSVSTIFDQSNIIVAKEIFCNLTTITFDTGVTFCSCLKG